MKKLTVGIVGVLLAGFVAQAKATEYADNPDHRPSIGVNYTGMALSGDGTLKDSGVSASQNIEQVSGELSLDLRVPLADSVTLITGVGFISGKSTADETTLLSGSEADLSGMRFSIGARIYLH